MLAHVEKDSRAPVQTRVDMHASLTVILMKTPLPAVVMKWLSVPKQTGRQRAGINGLVGSPLPVSKDGTPCVSKVP